MCLLCQGCVQWSAWTDESWNDIVKTAQSMWSNSNWLLRSSNLGIEKVRSITQPKICWTQYHIVAKRQRKLNKVQTNHLENWKIKKTTYTHCFNVVIGFHNIFSVKMYTMLENKMLSTKLNRDRLLVIKVKIQSRKRRRRQPFGCCICRCTLHDITACKRPLNNGNRWNACHTCNKTTRSNRVPY